MSRILSFRSFALIVALVSLLALLACSGGDAATSIGTEAPTKFAVAATSAAGPSGTGAPAGTANPTAKPGSTAAPNATAKPGDTAAPAKPLKMRSPEFGIQAFLWWRPETADRDLGLAKDAGFTWVKQQFAWRDIEGVKGTYDWGKPDNIVYLAYLKKEDLLIRVDNAPDWAAPGCFSAANKTMGPAKNAADWTNFLTTLVTRYKGHVRAYEIWNEPNLSREWCSQPPNPAGYAALLKASYAAIKAADPNAMIISAGLTPTTQNNAQAMPDTLFLEKLYDAMGNNSTGYFDVLGVHAPGFKAPPEMSPDDVAKNAAYNHGEGAAGRIYSFRHVEDMRKIMAARGDTNKQIALLEFGWTSDPVHPAYSWFKVDESTKGDYIIRAYKYAKDNWSPWIGVMSLIYLSNPDWDKNTEEYWWAITEPDGTPRAGYVAVQRMQK